MTTTSAPPSREAEIAARLAEAIQAADDGLTEPLPHGYEADVNYLLAHLQQAREALTTYGRHMASCEGHPNRRVYPTGQPCTCGLDAALKAVR